MTDPKRVAYMIANMTPEDMVTTFSELSVLLENRAGTVYEGDPEQNGVLAQPYANLSDLMLEASGAFTPELDDPLLSSDTESVLHDGVDAVSANTKNLWDMAPKPDVKNPWGKR